jgi:excinuclease ABC subunit C
MAEALRERIAGLPDQPGVYLFKDGGGRILYVGKALSLRKRVGSYRRVGQLSARIAQMMRQVAEVDVVRTSSEAEALLLENELIKQHHPRYNVALRDDKTYPMLKITREPFPRLLVTRRRLADGAQYFGPYTEAALMHQAVAFMRKVFPLRTCKTFPKSPCLEYHLGQCLAPCARYIDARGYQRMADDLAAFLRGEREGLLKDLIRRMRQASRNQRFEEAARVRDQIRALSSVIVATEKSHVAGPLEQLQAALKLPSVPRRIEAFDISNIFGDFAVGSMVVFTDGKPHKAHYRRFRIETVFGSDDFAMMREVVRRRYGGSLARELPRPDLILVDGGKGQLSAAREALQALALEIPAIGLAKRFEHIVTAESQTPIVLLPTSPVLHLVQRIRDEAHRVAITHHRQWRGKAASASLLREISGIGPTRALRLIRYFGSVWRVAKAQTDAIARVARISPTQAEEVLRHLQAPAPHPEGRA